jgi:inorganic pyrophosphatase
MLKMKDEKGGDNKILAVPVGDPMWSHFNDIHEIPPHLLPEIENFFMTYKRLEAKEVHSEGWEDAKKAKDYLLSSVLE